MSNTKHTPGPWKLHSFYDGWIVNQQDGPGFIETVYKHSHREEECEANARMISAAPELLEALTTLDERLKACAREPAISAADAYDSFYQEIVSSAISKARGEA